MTDSASVTTAYSDERVTLLHGDCIEAMRELPGDSVDSIVTDPPYGLGFMGKAWDDLPPGLPWAQECLRVLKPGGHLLAFGGSRTWHRLAVAVEDAGFEIRDSIAWLYGSGFPKSLDVSKAIDKARDERHIQALAVTVPMAEAMRAKGLRRRDLNGACGFPLTDGGSAQAWTTTDADSERKPRVPSLDHWAILRQLLDLQHLDETVRKLNVYKGTNGEAWIQREVLSERPAYGIGGNGVLGGHADGATAKQVGAGTPDAERWAGWGTALKPAFEPVVVGRKPLEGKTVAANVLQFGTGALNIDDSRIGSETRTYSTDSGMNARRHAHDTRPTDYGRGAGDSATVSGRWPANVILDESQAAVLDAQSGKLVSGGTPARRGADVARSVYGAFTGQADTGSAIGANEGGASRFFYCAKAPKSERPTVDGVAHPTVKPLSLMRYLVKLVTPPGGTVLEPFAGSGATVEAALLEGFNVIAVEREADYIPLILQRVERYSASVTELEFAAWLASVQDTLDV